MSSNETNLATAKTILSTIGTVAATAMVVRTVTHDYLPPEIQDFLFSGVRAFFSRFSNQITMVIDEFDGLVNNELYEAVEVYLGAKASPNMKRLNVSKPDQEKAINVRLETNEELADVHAGAKLKWTLVSRSVESKSFYNSRDMNATLRSEVRSFELSLGKKHKQLVLDSYFPHILSEAKSIKSEKKTTKLFTVDYNNMYNPGTAWTGVNLNHPAKFDTLAMDPELKETIMADLDRFVRRREYYRQVGKAWKRGYLLFGPPGTGKSSLIAAMANYLNFDIYDLELTELRANSELRRLLVATANRSILVVEDIDCTIELQDRTATDQISHRHQEEKEKVTLSGLLNFVDGLWSSCGDERIIIFTTNHKEKLDPALLRPGRMDVHIHMSYCTPCGFRLLASNYLGVKSHKLFSEIEKLIESIKVTPAEIAEQLLKSDDAELAFSGLVGFLYQKKKENESDKADKVSEDDSVTKENGGEN